ncbi:hypothetical protein F5890DRAFT_1479519, partial [Lentinula detonsa]
VKFTAEKCKVNKYYVGFPKGVFFTFLVVYHIIVSGAKQVITFLVYHIIASGAKQVKYKSFWALNVSFRNRFAGSIFMPPLLLKSYEGLVGAKLSGQLEGFFVTSPNMDVLTLPLVGTQTIRHRLQLHYGEHDPFLVAQPFDIRTAYLAMIRYPHSSDSTTTILWDLLDESEFEPIVDQKLADDPLGKFPNHYVKQLDQYHQTVRSSHSQLAHTQ